MKDKKYYIAIFKSETGEFLTQLENGILDIEKNPRNTELFKELNRLAHSIKGSAHVFGCDEIQQIAHRMEDMFKMIEREEIALNAAAAESLLKAVDAMRGILAQLAAGNPVELNLQVVLNALQGPSGREKSLIGPLGKRGPPSGEGVKNTPAASKPVESTARRSDAPVPAEEYVRVPVNKISTLLNLVGEVVINKMKSSHKVASAKKFVKFSREAQKRFAIMAEKFKEAHEGQDQALIRLLDHCQADYERIKESFKDFYDRISSEAFQMDPVVEQLQRSMKELRMLPCSTIFDSLPRMVRDIAHQQGKEVELKIVGEETELDKKVLEEIKMPIIHILRNAIDHGIESPEDRVKSGKSGHGTIRVSAYHEGESVFIGIEEDGRGMELEKIKTTALQKKLVPMEDLGKMSDKEILDFVFLSGFSTSPIITDISGRGVGLDVVKFQIEKLKGKVILETIPGRGTTFTLILPLTVAIIEVLMVQCGGRKFAFPISFVRECTKINASLEVSTIEGKMATQSGGQPLPLVRLDEMLGLDSSEEDTPRDKKGTAEDPAEQFNVIVASHFGKRVGFIVDDVIAEESVFLKSLGEHLVKIKNVSGATILGTGEVIVVLDVADLVTNSSLMHSSAAQKPLAVENQKKEQRILVVDDTFSTRELEKDIIATSGYTVDTAVDGLDALDKIAQADYDLIVTDIQMPRMNGFDLCKTIKGNAAYKNIPVIIITSLEKDEDKRKGIEFGASAYIVKSSFDQTNLLDVIERLIGGV